MMHRTFLGVPEPYSREDSKPAPNELAQLFWRAAGFDSSGEGHFASSKRVAPLIDLAASFASRTCMVPCKTPGYGDSGIAASRQSR